MEYKDRVKRALSIIGEVFKAHRYEPPTRLDVWNHDGVNAAINAGGIIMLSRGALNLPDDMLRAAVAHEVGHIEAGDIYRPEAEYLADRASFECAADAFAAQYVGAVTVRDLIRDYLPEDSYYHERIARLDTLAEQEKAT